MKAQHPIRIDKARLKNPPGGDAQDLVAQGRVQILPAGNTPVTQAVAVMMELERQAALDPGWDWATCAVIAREWKWLDAVRCYCEWRGIPAQFASEDCFYFWSLRETQAMLDLLAGKTLINAAQLNEFLALQPDTPARDMLCAALEDYELETDGSELPASHFRDWLAEWGREARRKQTGLLLVTAHGAKGLEFDHVAVLDGGWRSDAREDVDAVRRLYYVAMTRARRSLLLARLAAGNLLLDQLAGMPGLLHRPSVTIVMPDVNLDRQYKQPGMKDIDLGYPGRYVPSHPIHGDIARLSQGAPLSLEWIEYGWYLLDENRQRVGKMAKSFAPPKTMYCVEARVSAIIVKRPEEEYRVPKCERWEVVMPELVFKNIN
jgi:ATP-dependent DNA helicase RecQ